jgi:hypothetical protein
MIGENIYNWLIGEARYIVMIGLAIFGLFFLFKRESSKLIGFILLAAVAILFVFNATGVIDFLLGVGNTALGS